MTCASQIGHVRWASSTAEASSRFPSRTATTPIRQGPPGRRAAASRHRPPPRAGRKPAFAPRRTAEVDRGAIVSGHDRRTPAGRMSSAAFEMVHRLGQPPGLERDPACSRSAPRAARSRSSRSCEYRSPACTRPAAAQPRRERECRPRDGADEGRGERSHAPRLPQCQVEEGLFARPPYQRCSRSGRVLDMSRDLAAPPPPRGEVRFVQRRAIHV